MPSALVTPVAVTGSGINLTDAVFTTLVAGAGNGVHIDFNGKTFIALKNPTVGAAVFTVLLKTIPALAAVGITPANKTIPVAAGKTQIVPMLDVFKDASSRMVIECDVASTGAAAFTLP